MPGYRGDLRPNSLITGVDYVCKKAFIGTTFGLYAADMTYMDPNNTY